MTYKNWVNKYKGQKINYDKVYGVQCVDLIKHFIDKVLNAKPQSIGNAKEYWHKRKGKYISSLFVPIENTPSFIPKRGDVFVRTSGKCGHIGVCTGNASNEYFYAYEQNAGGKGEGMTRYCHTNWSTINFLRPKKQITIANLHAYTSKTSKIKLTIPKGSAITYDKDGCFTRKINGVVYTMSRIMYKGTKYYVADCYIAME